MGRRLNKSVLAGGVVYPAGTPATPELAEIIVNPNHWEGDGNADVDATSASLAVRSDLRDAIQRIAERHLADPTVTVNDLLRAEVGDEPDERTQRAVAMLDAAEAAGTAAVEIGGFRVEACDEHGQTSTLLALNHAVSQIQSMGALPGLQPPYDGAEIAALRAEVDRRNADRDPADERYLKADKRSKDQMVAALVADDAAEA